MKAIHFVFIFLFVSFQGFSQLKYSTDSKKATKLYDEAQQLLRQRKFGEAIDKLYKALEKDNDFLEAHLRLAFSFELLRELDRQQYHLEEVVRIAPHSPRYKNVYFSLGKSYFNQGKYDKAREQLEKMGKLGIENDRLLLEIKDLMDNIDYAMEEMESPIDIDPKALPDVVNSFPLQFFPVVTADENTLIYTARMGTEFHDDENIVISEKDENGNWTTPKSISPNINSQFNEGTCTISADGRTLIFTSCEGRKSYGRCDLYMSTRTGDEWSVPENLGSNVNSEAWDSQPALSADGRRLYFVSDRRGGYGKRDIWVSEKDENNQWTKAVNAGPKINTSKDEVSPFIHVNGTTLFFASKGFLGFGGFDIFKSELINNSEWSKPKNLGYPINTYEDQVSLVVSLSGKNAYYTYERKWLTKENKSFLYGFEFPEDGILENRSIYITGTIFDEETKEPLDAQIELYAIGDDKPFSIFNSDAVTGKYFSILNENSEVILYIDRVGYLFQSQSFTIAADSTNSIEKDIYLKPIKQGTSITLNNIFFELNSASLTESSKTELNKIGRFLSQNEEISITISGHTDDQGTHEYNMDLSERRAKAVYDFLVDGGINPENMTYKGFGETMPVVDNVDEASRKINRRIEFSID